MDEANFGGEVQVKPLPGETQAQANERARVMSIHEASRVKKAAAANARAIENRIKFFQREEEKIWRDLEEVRRQAATIEEGRSRTLEKKLADRTVHQAREMAFKENRAKAMSAKQMMEEQRKRNQFETMRQKQLAGQQQRQESQDILRRKRMMEAQQRLRNSERAVAIQRDQLEAQLRVNQERSERLAKLRQEQEEARVTAELEVEDVESRLPQLEAEEMACLQRLQNSRIVTQSVLEELEVSLGARSPVTSLLRMKQRSQGMISESVGEEGIDEEQQKGMSSNRGGDY